mmetsp:Transcript_13105/g.14359  ORF Transcript_13105/g.14359 Transcript_13105/m.14359 type:complete len:297 (-) Transcript_13105:64-954(-)
MSFQDVGKRHSQRNTVNASMGATNNKNRIPTATQLTPPTGGGSVFASMSISAATATTQISDSLTQYNRNVGILEKIAHALLTSHNSGRNRDEYEQQYKAQSDVLRELESRLKQQMKGQRARLGNQSSTASSTTSAHKQALLKLERDFERVQSTVTATKSKVTKQMKQHQQRGAAATAARQQQEDVDAANNANNHPNSAQQKLQQQQLVLQQDRLQEEIMKEREAEIRQINKGMHQVNEVYKDLAHIVGEQQEMVDGIETKMEDTKTSAQAGLEQISKANDKYSGGGKGGDSGCVIS